jgi:predicted MFS family arabinose efflux permease
MNQSPDSATRTYEGLAEESEGWSRKYLLRIILMIFVSEFAFMTYAFPAGVLPQISTDFGTDQAIWVVAAYSISAAAFSPLLGRVADKVGKKKVLLIMLAAGIVGALIVVIAPTFGWVIVGRVLQGLSFGLPFMNVSLARDIFPHRIQSLAIALTASGAGFLSILTSLATKPIVERFGWQGVFWAPAFYAVIVGLLLIALVPETTVRAGGRGFDLLGAFLLAAAVTCLLVPVSFGATVGWNSPLIIGLFIGGVVLSVIWVVQSLHTRSPVIALREFKYFPLLCAFLLAFIGFAAQNTVFSFWGFVIATPADAGLGYGLGLGVSDVGLFNALFSVASFAGGFTVGRLLQKRWPGKVAAAFFAVLGIGYAIAAFSLSSAVGFGVGVFVLAFAAGGNYALYYNMVALTVVAERQASTAAAVTTGMNIAGAIFPVVMFAVLNSHATFADGVPIYPLEWMRFVFLVPVGLAVVLVILSLTLVRYQRTHGGKLHEVAVDDE